MSDENHRKPHLYEAGTVSETPVIDGTHVDRGDVEDIEPLPPIDVDAILGEARGEQLRHYYAIAYKIIAALAAAYIAIRETGILDGVV